MSRLKDILSASESAMWHMLNGDRTPADVDALRQAHKDLRQYMEDTKCKDQERLIETLLLSTEDMNECAAGDGAEEAIRRLRWENRDDLADMIHEQAEGQLRQYTPDI